MPREIYFVVRNSGNPNFVFVKSADFFIEQGGLRERWGRNWKPVVATSIEDARKTGERELPYRA